MMHVQAVYQNGVFKPLSPLTISENQIVELSIHPPREMTPDWVAHLREVREQLGRGKPLFPDSALEIAQDRQR